MKDKILMSLALGESALILLYHILFNHLIFLFIIRVAKMLEQVTIWFILMELTLHKVNLRLAFTYSLVASMAAIAVVTIVLFLEGTQEILHEKKLIWTILSGAQVLISLVTLTLAIRLMFLDPNWGGVPLT